MREFEVSFLEINPDEIEKKLVSLGAKKISDQKLREIIFDKPDRSWNRIQKRVRLRRSDGKIELAYKFLDGENKMGGVEEIEFDVSDWDRAKKFVERLGLVAVREQEKRRITYKLESVTFDIDFWPRIPPYLEIEAESENEIRPAAEKLGLNWNDACFLDSKQIYIQMYGFKDFDNLRILTFDKVEYHKDPSILLNS